MGTILHFFTLPELGAELVPGSVVRVESAVQVINAKTPGLGHRQAAIHVRAADGDAVLVFMLDLGSVQTINGRPADSEAAEALDGELSKAERMIREYLQAAGFEVRPGLIDIGGADPVRGTWIGLADPCDRCGKPACDGCEPELGIAESGAADGG